MEGRAWHCTHTSSIKPSGVMELRVGKGENLPVEELVENALARSRPFGDLLESHRGSRRPFAHATGQPVSIANRHDYLGHPTIAYAIADHLLHNAHRLVLKGHSPRKRRTEEVRVKGRPN